MTRGEKILELKKLGYSQGEVSKTLKCSKSTVSKFFNLYKTELENSINMEELTDLYIKGYKTEKIAELMNFEHKFIKQMVGKLLLKLKNVEFKPDKELIIDEYLKIRCYRKTSKNLGIKYDLVKQITQEIYKNRKIPTKSESVISWRKKTKEKLVDYMGGCCQCCGYKKNIKALQFHHIDPTKKDFVISGQSISFEKLKNEADKCVLVCSNCHVEIHDEIHTKGYSEFINNYLKSNPSSN